MSVLERGRIERDPSIDAPIGPPARKRLPAVVYDRLFRVEGGREDRGERPLFTWGRNRATLGPWVGVLQVPGLQLEILPKVDDAEIRDDEADIGRVRDNLVEMLSVGGLQSARSRGLAMMGRREGTLHEQLVARFLDRLLEEFVRGADREYSVAEENLTTVRGRLDLARQLRHNSAQRHRFYCRFDELCSSTPISATLRAACDALARRSLSGRLQQRLSQAQVLLAEVDPSPALLAKDVAFTRQNERFSDLYGFARMLLDGEAPDMASGERATYSLLFDMDKVFERYIAAFIERFVKPRFRGALDFDAQSRRNRRELYRRKYSNMHSDVLHLAPDLYFSIRTANGGVRTLVADTKWKRLDPSKPARPANTDLYQLYAYLHRYECERAILLYPFVEGVTEAEFETAVSDASGRPRTLAARLIRLSDRLNTKAARTALADRLEDLVREGLGEPKVDRTQSYLSQPTLLSE